MKEPIAGMDKRKSKAESLYLKGEREMKEIKSGGRGIRTPFLKQGYFVFLGVNHWQS